MKQQSDLTHKNILVTGSPGFIGAHLVNRLLKVMNGGIVVSLDNMNDYYDVTLKEHRLAWIERISEASQTKHIFVRGSISDSELVTGLFEKYRFDIVVNLAAQAGVRYSIDHPDVFIESNIIGFYNILEACRHSYDGGAKGVQHLIYASSSSVYGENAKVPFSPQDRTDQPVSLYAATKKCDEMLAYTYAKLYNVPSTGLRFFTVYGPAGRPDMFYFKAAGKLAEGKKIQVFNYGKMKRDFTYIDDIVEGILRVMEGAPAKAAGDGQPSAAPHALYNIGGGHPVGIMDFLNTLKEELVKSGVLDTAFSLEDHLELIGPQPGDVTGTYADTTDLEKDYDFSPSVGLREGLRMFCEWFRDYTIM